MAQLLAAVIILTFSVLLHYAFDTIHRLENTTQNQKLRLHADELMRIKRALLNSSLDLSKMQPAYESLPASGTKSQLRINVQHPNEIIVYPRMLIRRVN